MSFPVIPAVAAYVLSQLGCLCPKLDIHTLEVHLCKPAIYKMNILVRRKFEYYPFACQGHIYTSLLYPGCNHCTCIQTTNNVYIHPVAVSSAAVRIISEQPRAYIYVQNHQLQQPHKDMAATKGVFWKVTWK